MSGLARHCCFAFAFGLALVASGAAVPPSSRSLELSVKTDRQGERLPAGSVARIGTTRFRGFLTLAQDGRTPLTLRDNRGCLIDPSTGREIRRLPGGDAGASEVQSCLMSPDGRFIAYGGFNFVDIWDIASGRRVCRCADGGPTGAVRLECQPLCFSPDSNRLVTVGQNAFIASQCWEVATGRVSWQLDQATDAVSWQGISFTPDGRYFVAAKRRQEDWFICLLAAETGAIVHQVGIAHAVSAAALSPDGAQVAFAENQGKVRRVNVWTGQEDLSLDLPYGLGAERLTYSPDGKRLVGVHPLGLHVWDTTSGKELHQIFDRSQLYQARVAITSDSKTLWTADRDEPVWHRFDISTGRETKLPYADAGSRPTSIAVSPDGRALVVSSSQSGTRLWSVDPVAPLRRLYDGPFLLTASSPELNSVAFSPDGRQIAGTQPDGRLHLWTAATGQLQRTLPGNEDFNDGSVAYSPDGQTVALAPMYVRDPKTEGIRLFDAATGTEKIKLPGASGHADCLSFSPDGKLLLALNPQDGEVTAMVYDVGTGAIVRQAHGDINAAVFLPFGRNVLCSGPEGLVLWELNSGATRLRLPLPERERLIDLLAVSPDGRLAAGANNGDGYYRIYLWDLNTGRELAPVVGHNHHITGVCFGPNARMLVTASKDTTVLVWDLSDRLLARASPPASPAEVESAWEALAADAGAAHAAQVKLLAAGDAAVGELRRRVPPAKAVDSGAIYRAISRLDAPRYADRERATRELQRWDQQAEPILRAARDAARAGEVRRRLDALLARSRGLSADGEQLRIARCVELLERLNSQAARALLADWAHGDPAARLTREASATLNRLRPKG